MKYYRKNDFQFLLDINGPAMDFQSLEYFLKKKTKRIQVTGIYDLSNLNSTEHLELYGKIALDYFENTVIKVGKTYNSNLPAKEVIDNIKSSEHFREVSNKLIIIPEVEQAIKYSIGVSNPGDIIFIQGEELHGIIRCIKRQLASNTKPENMVFNF